MAKYDITYACGHEGRVELFGPGKDRERKIAWLEEHGLCHECYKASMAAQQAALRVDKAEPNADNPLNLIKVVDLEGSEKQVKWAEDIRESFVRALQVQEDGNNKIASGNSGAEAMFRRQAKKGRISEEEAQNLIAQHAAKGVSAVQFFAAMSSAKFWIDNRDNFGGYMLWDSYDGAVNLVENNRSISAFYDEWLAEEHARETMTEDDIMREEIERDMSTMYPEDMAHATEVTVTTSNNLVRLRSDKDMDLIKIVKANGFYWDSPYWVKGIPTAVADMQDAAAEIANGLLNAGFPVLCKDAEVREKALTGNYTPVPKRYLTYCPPTNKIHIKWAGMNDDIYHAAHAIPGSKWNNPVVEVSAKHYQAIEGLADLYGFVISPGARREMDKAKAEALASTVKVAPHKSEEAAGADLEAILERPAEVMDKHVLED